MYNHAMTGRVLVVEDEPELARVLRDYLENAGFATQAVHDGPSALSLVRHQPPDLVLLDLNLPGVDGLDVAREIRRNTNTPIIMVTARVEEADRLIGLELGADDYILKPFSPREVVARVRAVLRRAQSPARPPEIVQAGDLTIDLSRHKVSVGSQNIDLTPTEFELLTVLAREPGRVFSRMQLLQEALGETYEGYERTIDAHIKNLRAKIEPDPKKPRYVETVFGVGYRFADE